MPRVAKESVQPHQLYGMTKVENNLTMGERIRKRFRPGDTVKVHNITNTEISWQWLEEADETYLIEEDTNIKITTREDPGLWRLGAGETDVLPGPCAYIMIEALYKQVCVMKTGIVLHPLDEREVKNFSLDDPERQEQFIEAVFMGKLTPSMMQQAAISQLGAESGPRITEHLAPLATETSEYQNRQASERRIVTRPHVEPEAPAHTDLADLAEEFSEPEPLGGRATGGLPEDRKLAEVETEEPPTPTPVPDETPTPAEPVTTAPPVAEPPTPVRKKAKEPAAV